MSRIVYGAPTTPPPPPGTKWPGVQITWTGWDGSLWTLTDETGGVYLPREGVSGLGTPKRERNTSTSPSRAGARARGTRVKERAVHLPIEVYTDGGSLAWLDLDAAFFRTLDADRPGLLRVTRPDGKWRELELYFDDDGDHVFAPDPSVVGWEVYGLNFVALDPAWRGKPITAGPWSTAGAAAAFFPGPPYNIGRSSTSGTVTVTNPGDYEAWPVWRAANGVQSLTVTLGGQVIESTIDVPEGSELLIDTDAKVARLDGVDVTEDLIKQGFAPLPKQVTTEVSVVMVGAGEVSCSFVPRYERAW